MHDMSLLDVFVNLQLWIALGLAIHFMTYSIRGINFPATHALVMAFFWPGFLIFYGLVRYREHLLNKESKDPDRRLH